jgi:hypothetical protein
LAVGTSKIARAVMLPITSVKTSADQESTILRVGAGHSSTMTRSQPIAGSFAINLSSVTG